MDDLISRRQAIDVIDKEQKEIDVSDVSAMYAYSKCKTIIKQLPSAQPDTYWKEQCQSYEQTINKLRVSLSTQPEIRCKDCKHRDKYGCCKHWKGLAMGDIPIATDDNDFCSRAERRTE